MKKIYCQQTQNSTQIQETDEQRRIKLVEALERTQDEVKASRLYIDGLEKQVKSKQSIIDAQTKKQTLTDEAITSLQKEVTDLQAVIESQNQTLIIQKTEVDYLKKELDKTNKKLKHSRSLNKYLIVVAGVLVLTSIFK